MQKRICEEHSRACRSVAIWLMPHLILTLFQLIGELQAFDRRAWERKNSETVPRPPVVQHGRYPSILFVCARCHAAILYCKGIIHTVPVCDIAGKIGSSPLNLPPNPAIQQRGNNMQDQVRRHGRDRGRLLYVIGVKLAREICASAASHDAIAAHV